MNIKKQIDLLIKIKGECIYKYPIPCKDCVLDFLCTGTSDDTVMEWAKRIKDDNYDVEAVLFDEVL